ncbi:MAG: F0F1 ATP synthase subunit gamma [Nitrospinae bacterium]|nr:F0F1 ATP synthase subunit gamma [Nitrospinota bacterium]
MASGKEIKNKIKTVSNTKKITKAMQMVAASKMKKAQDVVASARPYSNKIRAVLSHLAQIHPEYKHPYIQHREEVKSICAIVITTDKGLSGGLNGNLLRNVLKFIRANKEKTLKFICIGRKGGAFLKRLDINIIGEITGISEHPKLLDLVPAITLASKEYLDGNVDEVVCFYNTFVNTMSQNPTQSTLIPVPIPEKQKLDKSNWDYLYEPEAKDVMETLLKRYIEAVLYELALENSASEQSARMVAMKAATENAGDIIEILNVTYNKSRQASITQELSEIVAGANAIG